MRSAPSMLLAAAVVLAAASGPAFAYVGPGAGLTAIGTVIALIGAVALAAIGFVWYPIKRLRARRRSRHASDQASRSS